MQSKITPLDETVKTQLDNDICDLVETEPERFFEAGKWLDHYYSPKQCAASGNGFNADRQQSKFKCLRVAHGDLLASWITSKRDQLATATANNIVYLHWLFIAKNTDTFKPKIGSLQDISTEQVPHEYMRMGIDEFTTEEWYHLCHKASVKIKSVKLKETKQNGQVQEVEENITFPIANCKLARLLNNMPPGTLSKQIQRALKSAGKAVKKVGPGKKREWSERELVDACPGLPDDDDLKKRIIRQFGKPIKPKSKPIKTKLKH